MIRANIYFWYIRFYSKTIKVDTQQLTELLRLAFYWGGNEDFQEDKHLTQGQDQIVAEPTRVVQT